MRTTFLCLLALACAAAQEAPPGQAGQAADEKKLASLDGVIVNATTGEPVRKANLMLMMMPSGARTGMVIGGPPQSIATSSDGEGKFSFTRLEPGTYYLSAEKTGFVRQQYGSRGGQLGGGTPLTLTAGQKLSGLQFKLTPQGVIAGKVLDEDGEPMAHVQIMVMRQTAFSRQPMGMGGASTNDVGEFRIGGLTEGKYVIRAQRGGPMQFATRQAEPAKAEGTTDYVPTFYPSATDAESAAPVMVASGQTVNGIDIQMRKARVFRVSGKVHGVSADPASRVQVSLQPQKRDFSFGIFGGGSAVKADGSFVLGSVQPGSYYATVMSFESGRPQVLARTPVTVANGNVENVVIQAGNPLAVVGRAVFDGEATTKISGQVMLQPAEGLPFMPMPARIQEDGTFKLDGVSREKHNVMIMGLGEGLYVKGITAAGADVLENGLDLSKAETAPPLEIRISSKGATIEGIVRQADQPAPGAMVMLLPHPLRRERVNMFRRVASSDQNGQFSLKGVAPGEYRLYAWEGVVPFGDLEEEQLKPYEKFALTLKVREEGREQVELKLAQLAQ